MPNPFNALNPMNADSMAGIRNAYQMLTQSRNPMQVFQQLAQQNPRLQPAMQMLRQGINPQQIFNTMCQQRGINPQEFLRNITGR
jgi:hypothetical protein